MSTEPILSCFCRGSTECNNLVVTLVKLEKWAASVLASGLEPALAGIAPLSDSITVADLNTLIAEGLTRHARGLQGEFLRKSIQETLFHVTGTEDDLTVTEFEKRLKRFLRRRGLAGFIQRFISLHVFNVVWFDTCERSRTTADLSDSFLHKMQSVKTNCRKIVRTVKHTLHPLTTSSAEKLIVEISRQLQDVRF